MKVLAINPPSHITPLSSVVLNINNLLTMSIVPVTAFPRDLLPKLFLTGDASLWVVQSDPRFHYRIYIPDGRYPQSATAPEKLPLVVAVHGTSRHLERHINVWKDFADENGCAVLAPRFPAGLQGPLDVDGYHFLGRPPKLEGGSMDKILREIVQIPGANKSTSKDEDTYQIHSDVRHDLVLLEMLSEIGLRWPAIEVRKVYMVGFSGGGQFTHRFLYLHPDRLLGASIGAPGNVTYLDLQKEWPTGISNLDKIFGKSVDIESVKAVPVLCVVGADDVKAHGPKARAELKRENIDGKEDIIKNRVEMLGVFAASLKVAGLQVVLEFVDGAAHEMEKCSGPVIKFVQELMTARAVAL